MFDTDCHMFDMRYTVHSVRLCNAIELRYLDAGKSRVILKV